MTLIPRPENLKENHVDVLVIGAGPAGSMCAHGLVKAGLNVRIIDKKESRITCGQADGLQPRTTEVLASYGLAERAIKEGCPVHTRTFYQPDRDGNIHRTSRVPYITAPGGPYPFVLTTNQGAVEALFTNSMLAHGVEVERPFEPVSLKISADQAVLDDPNSHPVEVQIRNCGSNATSGDAVETIHAKYVVGCDGAHSWVRRALDIPTTGERTEQVWGVVDLVPETAFPDVRTTSMVQSNEGLCMLVPRERDMVRLYIRLDDNDCLDKLTGKVDLAKMGPERLLEVANKAFHPYTVAAPQGFDWWTIYVVGQRVADKFSVAERVFIAGDACHTHSPKAAQGMNASINDSHNLVWKLTYALRGWGGNRLLKTYESERRQYAMDLINFDKKYFTLFAGPQSQNAAEPKSVSNTVSDSKVNGIPPAEVSNAVQASGRFRSGIGIHYGDSAIVKSKHQSSAKNVTIGQRMPPEMLIHAASDHPVQLHNLLPADLRFKILVFTGDLADATQREKVEGLAREFGSVTGILARFPRGVDGTKMFDILTILSGQKGNVNYTDVPAALRSHWSKVLLDDVDMTGSIGGKAYEAYGIASSGGVVVIRPDGYVGTIVPLEKTEEIGEYFASFIET